jgi:hypothetical protein
VARADRFDDGIGVRGEAGFIVGAGQIDRDRVLLGFFEERHDTMPVPGNSTSTRNEDEGSHLHLRLRTTLT